MSDQCNICGRSDVKLYPCRECGTLYCAECGLDVFIAGVCDLCGSVKEDDLG